MACEPRQDDSACRSIKYVWYVHKGGLAHCAPAREALEDELRTLFETLNVETIHLGAWHVEAANNKA
jgi:hypothetical protein